MGLKDLINRMGKADGVNYVLNANKMQLPSPVEREIKEGTVGVPYYNLTWLSRVGLMRHCAPNSDNAQVAKVLATLNKLDGRCDMMGEEKCMCADMRTNGVCKAGLFKNIPDRTISGSSEAKFK